MAKWLVLVCSILALGVVAGGCGGDDEEEPEGGGGAARTEPAKPKAGAEVRMKNNEFDPASLTVRRGTTVQWTNDDSVGHDVTKEQGPGPDFKSGTPGSLQRGDTYQLTFSTPGKVAYVCTVHPGMEGTVTVR
jgi:plastocyanin